MKSYTKAYIPYGGYYSTPFSRWQGSMQNDNAVSLAAKTARRWFLEKRKIDPTIIDYLYFGSTVAQNHWFIAHNWASSHTDGRQEIRPRPLCQPGLLDLHDGAQPRRKGHGARRL